MFVILNDAGHQADEVDTPLLGVPGHKELVQVGVRTQPPQLEVHLARVLAGAGDRDVSAAHEVSPSPPPRVHEATVLPGATIQHINSIVQINLLSSVIVPPFPFLIFITEISIMKSKLDLLDLSLDIV